jgi:nucleoside-diphosphate-sugar epimerase
MRRLLEVIAEAVGRTPRWIPVPEPLLRLAGPAADALCSGFGLGARPLADKVRELLPDYWVVDVEKARRELGFSTEVGLADGIAETADFYRREGWI